MKTAIAATGAIKIDAFGDMQWCVKKAIHVESRGFSVNNNLETGEKFQSVKPGPNFYSFPVTTRKERNLGNT